MAHETQLLITDVELLRLGLPGAALSAVDSTVRDEHRRAASDFALSHVKKRHTLPLVEWGHDLKVAVVACATLSLMQFRGFDPASKSGEEIIRRAESATNWLRDVAKGIVEPVDLVDSTPDTDEEAPLVASDDTAGWTWPSTSSDCEDDRTGF